VAHRQEKDVFHVKNSEEPRMVALDKEQLCDMEAALLIEGAFYTLPCAKHHNGFAVCANQFFVFQLF
jgi:hypothetical protein